ncbi:MAG: hypothetical protein IIT46_00945, partial [Lachnospiraceae bacterium]|nr:hypothetical protein [Lachnospiraceae bacterium]
MKMSKQIVAALLVSAVLTNTAWQTSFTVQAEESETSVVQNEENENEGENSDEPENENEGENSGESENEDEI